MRRTTGISGAGAVLLAVLAFALLIGLGSTAIEAYENRSSDQPSESLAPIVVGAMPTAETATDVSAAIGEAEPEPTVGPLFQAPEGVTALAVHSQRLDSGEVLIDRAGAERMQVGSIVKVATAVVTLQYVELDDEVLIDSTDLVDPAIYSNMALIAGDTLTIEQLLMGLLVPSGGDAAEALARHVGGIIGDTTDPVEARAVFVSAMNDWAAELGLQNTRFANASGDDSDDSYSTAADVSMMAAELLDSPVLSEMVAMPSYTFTSSGGNEYVGYNTNSMLGEGGVFGVKTGSTGNAGGCVVLARTEADGSVTIITILGADLAYNELNQIVLDARWDDARLLFSTIDS